MINNPIQSSIDAKMRVNGGFFIFSSFLSPFSWYYHFFYVLLRQDCNININCREYGFHLFRNFRKVGGGGGNA